MPGAREARWTKWGCSREPQFKPGRRCGYRRYARPEPPIQGRYDPVPDCRVPRLEAWRASPGASLFQATIGSKRRTSSSRSGIARLSFDRYFSRYFWNNPSKTA